METNKRPLSLITGANRGIGLEVARQLVKLGHTILLTGRSLDKAKAAASHLGSAGLVPVQLDVTDPASIATLHARVARDYGRLDILINNAAINYDTWQNTVTADLDNVQATLDTNLYGAWRMVQAFLPLLRKSAHPRIVNVSSESGSLAGMGGGTPAYSISKVALNGLTRKLAAELRSDRILVNAICPGWIATDMGGAGGGPVQEGGARVVWAATLPDDGPTGGFFRDGQQLPW